MTSYQYISLKNSDIPSAPIVDIQITSLNKANPKTVTSNAFLDTGSDCTLIPLNILSKIEAKLASGLANIQILGVGGRTVTVYPYYVKILIAQKSIPLVKVYGCSPQDTNEIIILGRDIINRLRIQFDGPKQTLTFY